MSERAHKLRVVMEDDWLYFEVECPHTGADRPCALWMEQREPFDLDDDGDPIRWKPTDDCWVREHVAEGYADFLGDIWHGRVEVGVVDVDYDNIGGSFEDSQLVLMPAARPFVENAPRVSTLERAAVAGRRAAQQHNEFTEDDDGFCICKCGAPRPDPVTWADHYVAEALSAACSSIEKEREE